MKFAEHLSAHITPEWRKQYILYEEMKKMIYDAMERQPSQEVAENEDIIRYNKAFDEEFFGFCEKELAKINTFFAEKLAESTRKFSNLKAELNLSRAKFNEEHNINQEDKVSKRFFDSLAFLTKENRSHIRKMHELKLALSEFYLSLVLIQNYQNLNFTGFVKILKKHDKLVGNENGIKWRDSHVESAPFHTNKAISSLIEETENLFTSQLEGGDRGKAMKRLRVPPLNDAQSPWVTFKVGFYSGCFIILAAVVMLTAYHHSTPEIMKIAFRLFRSSFFIILFLFFLGINVYGWRTSGVNHVLIFELDPRDHLSEQDLMEIASQLSVIWCIFVISFVYAPIEFALYIPLFLVLMLLLYTFSPFGSKKNSRVWLMKVMGNVICAPFKKVNFADFWLADQLNSLVPLFTDLQYFICFYVSCATKGFNSSFYESHDTARCLTNNTNDIALRAIVSCLPAWFRFAQCLRRYYDDKRSAFPHLVNAGKYSTTFFVVIFSTLTEITRKNYSASHENPFFILWIISALISSCYTYTWDIKMDWGLIGPSDLEYPFLREEIVYSSSWYYYAAIAQDLILRFTWTLSISLTEIGIINSDLMVSILAPLEIMRRFIWNFFRLENEHLNNCGEFRAVRDISVAPIDAGDQAKLIKMMDDPDGRSYRSSLKSRKSKLSVKVE